jgi:hypothetical protein
MGENRNSYKVFVGNTEGKRSLGRSGHRWKESIRMDLKEIGCGGVDWMHLEQERYKWRALVNTVINPRVP